LAFNKQKALDSAQKFLQKGQIEKAIVEYRKVCEADPEDLRAMQKLGDLYVRQGARQEAIAVYTRLAETLTARGFANRAVSIYKQILQLNPLLVPVYVKLSELFKELGLSKDARIFNQRAIEILQKTGNQDDLQVLLRRIVEGDPEDAISRITLAETYLKSGNTDRAVEELQAALPLLREQKLDELFIRAAERLLYHDPDNVDLCRELAVLHLRRHEVPRAMKLLLFCRKKDPEDVETMDLLARHFIASGHGDKAIMVLAEKVKVHDGRGEEDLVRETWRRILEVDPSNKEAAEALGMNAPSARPSPPPPGEEMVEAEIPIFEDSVVGSRETPAPPPARRISTPPPEEPGQPAPSETGDPVAAQFLDEAEVFLKYGLVDKAVEHLRDGLEKAEDRIALHEKLKDVLLDRGEMDQAIRELFALAEHWQDADPERARIALKEILLINPDQPRARSMLSLLESGGSAVPPPAPVVSADAGAPAATEDEIEEVEEFESIDEIEPMEVEPLEEIEPARPAVEAFDSVLPTPPGTVESDADRAGQYDSFLDDETSDIVQPLPSMDSWEDAPTVEDIEPEPPVPEPEPPSIEPAPPADDADFLESGDDEAARALESVSLPDLELDDLAALETETDEISRPGVPSPPVEEPDEVIDVGEPEPAFDAAAEAQPPVGESLIELEDEDVAALEHETEPEPAEAFVPDRDRMVELEEPDEVVVLDTETTMEETAPAQAPLEEPLIEPGPEAPHAGEPEAAPMDDLFPALDEAPREEPEAAPAPPPAPPASSTAVEEALEEADFFVQQGLTQEAVLYLEDLLVQYPGNRLVQDKLAELRGGGQGEPAQDMRAALFSVPPEPILETPTEEITEDSIESRTMDEAFDALDAIESIINTETVDDGAVVGQAPTEIDPSDARTHYDLGVAYMEMGVWEQALQEFRIASSSPDMEAICYNMIGNCLFKTGQVEEAIKEYKLGLFAKDKSQDQELNLYYDIAEAYIKLDDVREAIYYLQNIKKKDPGFKDVKLKLIALSSSYKPTTRPSALPKEVAEAPAKDPGESAREVDDAFDDLFGDFSSGNGE